MSDGLVAHLERSLGTIAGGWTLDADGRRLPFSVVRLENAPWEGVTTYATLGLSRYELDLPGKSVRQELLFAVQDRFASNRSVGVLVTVGEQLIADHRALLRGEVSPPIEPVTPGSPLAAIYAASPVIFPDEVAVFDGSDPPTVVVWLVPVSPGERELIESHGWTWFENQLVDQQPDLFDLMRDPIQH